MGREINEILKQIGCSEGMTVPVANEINQNLQKELEEKLRRKADAILKLEHVDEWVASLKNHLQNLSQEKEQNQQLLTAHQSQLDTEYSLLQQTTFNLSKAQQDIRNLKKNVDILASQEENLQILFEVDTINPTSNIKVMSERIKLFQDLSEGLKYTDPSM